MSSQYVKPPLQPLQYARNGKYPDAAYQSQMADLANLLAMYRMKEVVSFGMTTNVIASSPDSSDRYRWRGRYRASPHVRAVAVRATLALAVQTLDEFGVEVPAKCRVNFKAQDANSVAWVDLHYGNATTESAIPDDCSVIDSWVFWDPIDAPSGETIWSPTADTLYDIEVYDIQSRVVSLTIFEIPLTFETWFTENYAVKTPILDTDRSELLNAARKMWKQQAAPLFTWSVDNQAAPRTRTSATAINLIDNASTAVSSATVGFTVDLRERSTIARTTVPCVLEIYAKVSADEGEFYLKDSTGSALATIAVTGSTAAWHSEPLNLPATRAKYDLHFAGNGTDELSVYAVSLRQYASGS